MQADVVVLGAGMVGVSVAVHLQQRGKQGVLVDRRPPRAGGSDGHGRLAPPEGAVAPPLPRPFARTLSVVFDYHWAALPGLLRPLYLYWRYSAPDRYPAIALSYSTLIATCKSEHEKLAAEAGSTDLLRPVGFIKAYTDPAAL